ncbi:hypothetical protein [Candidatus Laterigemmans baculatus]|uniref:hypothetical protein n=1 Tax=Candidatus Laterigemmans baculatus TaxID=2770505 RepID=UPI0013DC000B|nr:hypothetical protein [Candidatus Laterigemmans baculatus]
MKPTQAASNRGGRSWSHQLQERYALHFDACLAEWFDSGGWQLAGRGEFNQPVSPEVLLAENPEVLWPALMLPDSLPVLGNRKGDWLCLRIGSDSAIAEVIHWYHGGGDWIPWGRTLAEAIVFDSLHDRLPGRNHAHAVAAEPRRAGDGEGALVRWASDWLPSEVRTALGSASFPELVEILLEHRVSEVGLRSELVLAALDSGLRRWLTPEIAAELGIPWEPDAVSWLFDTALVDEASRSELRRSIGGELDFSQDWQGAAKHAAAVCRERGDLGWAFDVAGWAAEREGNVAEAAEYYRRGAVALAFADQSIRFRTHWFPPAKGKFSLWRLEVLESQRRIEIAEKPGAGSPKPDEIDGYLQAIAGGESGGASAGTLRSRAADYWRSVALTATEQGRPADAYEAHYRAGWDLGLEELGSYRQRLASLVEAAEKAGQLGRARVAQAHLDTFLHRFG